MSNDKRIEVNAVVFDTPVMPEDAGKVDITDLILKHYDIKDRDVIVIASKIVAILEGRCVRLDSVVPSRQSKRIAQIYDKDPSKIELIRREGRVFCVIPAGKLAKKKGYLELVLLQASPDLSPENAEAMAEKFSHVWIVKKFGYFADSAGIDGSNVPDGWAVMLPKDPAKSAQKIRESIKEKTGKSVAILITDTLGGSPVLLGSWDVPIGFAGIDPLEKKMGALDIFGKTIAGGRANLIVPISTMAGLAMGNCEESTPIVVISGVDYEDPEEEKGMEVAAISKPMSLIFGSLWGISSATVRYFLVWLKTLLF